MKFIKFPSLTNAYSEKFINLCQMKGIKDWTVTEKVHGANMGIYCDGETVRVASRNNLVGLDFFNCEPVISKYKKDIIQLWENLHQPKGIIVYGEYFGGIFNGGSGQHAKKVQKGIDYNHENDFLAFNVLVTEMDNNTYWIDTDTLENLLFDYELRTVPILFTGSLLDCLSYKNEYNSTVPSLYDLESIDNVCEGNVIMPLHGSNYVVDGVYLGIKNKNNTWSEKGKAPKLPMMVDENLSMLTQTLLSYCTDNRFQNVMSKEGEFENKLIGKYLGLFQKDCWEDYLSDGNLVPSDKESKRYMSKQLTNYARPFVLKCVE